MIIARGIALAGLAALLGVGVWSAGTRNEPVGLPSDSSMPSVLSALLFDVYEGFAAPDEFAIYDGIAAAVTDDLVADLYLQQREASFLAQEDGGVTTILSVDLEDWQRLDRQVKARWTVLARIDHEEHSHERLNSYAAVMELTRLAGDWKIAALEIEELEREDEPEFFDP